MGLGFYTQRQSSKEDLGAHMVVLNPLFFSSADWWEKWGPEKMSGVGYDSTEKGSVASKKALDSAGLCGVWTRQVTLSRLSLPWRVLTIANTCYMRVPCCWHVWVQRQIYNRGYLYPFFLTGVKWGTERLWVTQSHTARNQWHSGVPLDQASQPWHCHHFGLVMGFGMFSCIPASPNWMTTHPVPQLWQPKMSPRHSWTTLERYRHPRLRMVNPGSVSPNPHFTMPPLDIRKSRSFPSS
jgi:hypothetical protein